VVAVSLDHLRIASNIQKCVHSSAAAEESNLPLSRRSEMSPGAKSSRSDICKRHIVSLLPLQESSSLLLVSFWLISKSVTTLEFVMMARLSSEGCS
jgi:hypothetical protein